MSFEFVALAARRFFLFIFLFTFLYSSSAYAHGAVHFKNGKWYNGKSFEPADFYSLEGVLRKQYKGPTTRVVDLQGKYVIPPLADAHNHGFSSPQRLEDEIQSALSQAIFYIMNPNNIAPVTAGIRQKLNSAESVDVVWSNGGLTSSGGHPVQIYEAVSGHGGDQMTNDSLENQAYYIINSLDDLRAKWPLIIANRPDFIKVYLEYSQEFERRKEDPAFYGQRGLDPKLLPDIVKIAHDSRLRVAAHVNTREDFRAAILSGVDIVAHLPLELITAEDAQLAAKSRTAVVTTTLSHRPTDHVTNLKEVLRDNLKTLQAQGVTLAFGTDSHRSVIDEAENILALQAMDRQAVLNVAAKTTAQVIFPERKIGELLEGYEANFVALDADPLVDFSNVRKVAFLVKKGHLLSFKASIATLLKTELTQNGIDSAIRLYRKIRTSQPDEYDFSEKQLNRLGYELLQEHKLSEAIEIFKLNIEFFPDSSNVYDSLGEAYMLHGDIENARTNYRRSLDLNPHNKNAVERLQKLESGENQ